MHGMFLILYLKALLKPFEKWFLFRLNISVSSQDIYNFVSTFLLLSANAIRNDGKYNHRKKIIGQIRKLKQNWIGPNSA